MAKKKTIPYITTDLTFAASLMVLGKKLRAVDPTGHGNELEFTFDNDNEEIFNIFEDYINGDLQVDPNSLMNHIRNLKASARGKL